MDLSIGANVVYGTNGVCTVTDIRTEDFGTGNKTYYVLRPASQKTGADIFVPKDSQILMGRIKQLLSPDEIRELISSTSGEKLEWIEDSRTRGLRFEEIISTGDRRELILLIKTVYEKKKAVAKQGGKLGVSDDRAMRTAEKILCEEFAAVLNVKTEEVVQLISSQIKCVEKSRV